EEQPPAPADLPPTRDAPELEALRIDHRRQASGQPSLRGAIKRSGRTVAQRLVRPLLVVDGPETVERPLLLLRRLARRPGGFRLQGAVHALVRATISGGVLLACVRRARERSSSTARPPSR